MSQVMATTDEDYFSGLFTRTGSQFLLKTDAMQELEIEGLSFSTISSSNQSTAGKSRTLSLTQSCPRTSGSDVITTTTTTQTPPGTTLNMADKHSQPLRLPVLRMNAAMALASAAPPKTYASMLAAHHHPTSFICMCMLPTPTSPKAATWLSHAAASHYTVWGRCGHMKL